MTQNLSVNATVNPDFSQVEADVGQVTVNERFALFYPEKRPFFLECLEQFDTPNKLIYMRRIQAPIGGAKLTGKTGSTAIAYLAAVDDGEFTPSGATRLQSSAPAAGLGRPAVGMACTDASKAVRTMRTRRTPA
jgi:hypothetical protein